MTFYNSINASQVFELFSIDFLKEPRPFKSTSPRLSGNIIGYTLANFPIVATADGIYMLTGSSTVKQREKVFVAENTEVLKLILNSSVKIYTRHKQNLKLHDQIRKWKIMFKVFECVLSHSPKNDLTFWGDQLANTLESQFYLNAIKITAKKQRLTLQ